MDLEEGYSWGERERENWLELENCTVEDLDFMDWEEPSWMELQELNTQESGEPVCERCNMFHPDLAKAPVRTMYASGEQPQPLLCPMCMEEWNSYWDDMWDEYNRGRL